MVVLKDIEDLQYREIAEALDSILPIRDSLSHAVFYDPAFCINRLPSGTWQLYPSGILDHPADLLEVFQGAFA